MHHAAAKDFQPPSPLANRTTLALAKLAADVHFRTRFGERKITRSEPDPDIVAEHLLHEEIQCLFQVCERNILVDIKPLHLMEETM